MRVQLVVASALLATLTACGGDESPGALPAVSAAPTSTAPSAPAPPPSAQAATPQGAAQFARFWFTTLNEAAASGDTAALRALSAPGCTACKAYADSIDTLYRDFGGIEGGQFTVVAAEAPALEPGSAEAAVTLVYDVSDTKQLAKDGSVARELPGTKGRAGEMRLVRAGSSWQVAGLTAS